MDTPTAAPTQLVHTGAPSTDQDRRFYAALEGVNHTGSMKYRSALHMVEQAHERGNLKPGQPIAAATSGSFGLALAEVAQHYDHPLTLLVDDKLEHELHARFTSTGATARKMRGTHRHESGQRARREEQNRIAAEGTHWIARQDNNPHSPEAFRSLDTEIANNLASRRVHRIDALVVSVGTGGHSQGVRRQLRKHFPNLHVIGVDAVGSAIFGQESRPRVMAGFGNDVPSGNVDYDLFDEVHFVNTIEAVNSARALRKANPLASLVRQQLRSFSGGCRGVSRWA